jgi:hypothetical protein
MPQFTHRQIVGAAFAIPGAIVMAAWLLQQTFALSCGNTLVAEFPSPTGQVRAAVFVRDCGATTDYCTHVSLLGPADHLKDDAGNVLVVDSDHGRAPAALRRGPDVQVTWKADTLLVLRYDRRDRVFHAIPWLEHVTIQHETFE